jgi:hypothetical protein
MIKPQYLNRCAFCNQKTVENFKHLTVQCNVWKRGRFSYLSINEVDESDPRSRSLINTIIKSFLGGDNPASD